jgi:hypothetical protein
MVEEGLAKDQGTKRLSGRARRPGGLMQLRLIQGVLSSGPSRTMKIQERANKGAYLKIRAMPLRKTPGPSRERDEDERR